MASRLRNRINGSDSVQRVAPMSGGESTFESSQHRKNKRGYRIEAYYCGLLTRLPWFESTCPRKNERSLTSLKESRAGPTGSPASIVKKEYGNGSAATMAVSQRSVKPFPQGKHCQFESDRSHIDAGFPLPGVK